jgi:DNA-binding transcriptional LysR family regulator
MRFDLTDLRLFLNVVEAGSLTGGAGRSHMTLASASQRVRGMEDALGNPLLTRHAQGVRPTEAGRTLLHHARVVLQQMERLRGELGEYGQGLEGHLRLLCNTSAMTEHLPQVLSRFLAQHPRISVDLEERASQDIVDALRAGLCDIGIVSDAIGTEGLEQHLFRRDDLVLVMPRGHALAGRRRVRLADVVDSEFVGLAAGSPLQEHVAQHARALGKRLSYRVRVRSFEAVCRMVEQGIGVGVVPQTAALRCARSMKISRTALADDWAARQLLACVRTGDELPRNARRMLQHLLAPSGDAVRPQPETRSGS